MRTERQQILIDLARWERPRKVLVRHDSFAYCNQISDFMMYKCPLVGQWRIAFISTDGIYWTLPNWIPGGVIYGVKPNGEMIQLPVTGDNYGMGLALRRFLEKCEEVGVIELSDGTFTFSVNTMEYQPDTNSPFMLERIRLVEHWADLYRGATSLDPLKVYETTARSARERHVRANNSRKSRQKRKEHVVA